MLRQMAAIYADPCDGAPRQPEAARSLIGLSNDTRTMWMWIYLPG
jgi:hypothetical protein